MRPGPHAHQPGQGQSSKMHDHRDSSKTPSASQFMHLLSSAVVVQRHSLVEMLSCPSKSMTC
eukprot:1230174-Amphidinium_carterae.1